MNVRLKDLVQSFSLIFAGAALASCGEMSATPAIPHQASSQTTILKPRPAIYVANAYNSPSVTVYPRNAKGDALPLQSIAGSNTELQEPLGIAVDRHGKIYVANVFGGSNGYGSILVFPANANGNVAPLATITQGLDYPYGVALDATDNVYVANNQGGSITVYSAKTYKPIRTISGDNTNLYPVGVALDSSGNLYVVNFDDESSGLGWITVYAAGESGDVTPIRQISGHRTGLTDPGGGIAIDTRGNLYVTNDGYPNPQSILVFGAGSHGNAKPIRTIGGSKTRLAGAAGLALDAHTRIYATTTSPLSGPTSVVLFSPNARGNVNPIREIEGAQTGLFASAGIYVR